MQETNTIIIGASVSGLASAGCLTKLGIDHIVIEKQGVVGYPWHNHYKRLHLHTNKKLSNLPFKKFDNSIPKYPSRQQVVDYLGTYQKEFNIQPYFNTAATSVSRKSGYWIVKTTKGNFKSENVIVATGPFGKPRKIKFKGLETFRGSVIHSFGYHTGKDFIGQNVLVVGFGNSACEIAMDLHEQKAYPTMSVRSAVNVLPRDILGIPILQLGLLSAKIPPCLADQINAPFIRLLVGNIEKLGLKKLPYGPLEQINKYQSVPLLDFGTLKLIKKEHINIYDDIDFIDGNCVHFVDGKKKNFDAIIAAIGYDKGALDIIKVPEERFTDLKNSVDNQKLFGKDGLYFCGFWVSPTGQFREIALDAKKITKHISERRK